MEGLVIEGVVAPGRQIGRQIGFPTANIALGEGLQVEGGVYRSEVEVEGVAGCFRAMSNVGSNPSVGGGERRLESHLIGFCGELYGRRIRVRLVEKLREEVRFGSLEELKAQLEKDKQEILQKE